MSRFCKGRVGQALKIVKDEPKLDASAAASGLRSDLSETSEEMMQSVAAELCHTLTRFTNGKAAKIVTTVVEGEGFEAWRMLQHRYEPVSNTTTVQKLIDVLESNFRGDLLEAEDDFEKRIQMYEQQSGETVTDNLKI